MTPYSHRQRRANFKGVASSHHEALALLSKPGDIAIVKRGVLRSAVMRCPDGCGETITLNLDPRTAKAWRIYRSKRGLTLFPSVWRDTGCQSHFVLWDNVISWVDISDMEVEGDTEERRELKERVWAILKPDAYTDFVQVADSLDQIPWSVLGICLQLVKEKRAVAGAGDMRSSFRKLLVQRKS